MKQLPPIIFKEDLYKNIEEEINDFFLDTIYKPLITLVNKYIKVKLNSISSLINAILTGKIQYGDGKFSGKFTSTISKELKKMGAKFSKRSKTWNLPLASITPDVRGAIAQAQVAYELMTNEIASFAKNLDIEASLRQLDLEAKYKQTIDRLETSFRESSKALELTPELTEAALANIAKDYSQNLKLYIKKWSDENIYALRQKVEANFQQGFRADNLVNIIQKNYGVSKTKSKFLASQETKLLSAEFTKNRYLDAGVQKFKWSTSHDSRVRSEHRELNGKVFLISDPPVIDAKTGQRGLPKQAFGCRCKMIALID